jgi:hypothetical protein
VQPTGIEPVSTGLQPDAMTTSAKVAYKLVPQAGIEPTHPDYKTGPLPLRIQGQ